MRDIVGTKDKKFLSLGRNGTMYTIGLDVQIVGDTIRFTPINSKINLGKSRISMPIESIDDLIHALQRAKNDYTFCYKEIWYDQDNSPPTQISKSSLS